MYEEDALMSHKQNQPAGGPPVKEVNGQLVQDHGGNDQDSRNQSTRVNRNSGLGPEGGQTNKNHYQHQHR
jgi:hypothetical protein